MSFKWWMEKMGSICCLYRFILVIHSKIMVCLKNITIIERNESQKTTYYMISFLWHLYSGKGRTIVKERSGCQSPGPRDRQRDWLPLAVWPHPLSESSLDGLFWETGNTGKDTLISATGWCIKSKCDGDNTELLDPARSKSRCVPREPVNPSYCLSSSEL